MKIPQIERELKGRVDDRVIYWFRHQQEQIIQIQHQMNQCADLLVQFYEALQKLQHVNLQLNERWEQRLRGRDDPDLVQSVLPEENND